ncbi:MAG: hypothetical protein MZU95_13025 [Desulfomicrobium escambiense]|nr:hypothetical protein [Desulfomicrobium escambiense]
MATALALIINIYRHTKSLDVRDTDQAERVSHEQESDILLSPPRRLPLLPGRRLSASTPWAGRMAPKLEPGRRQADDLRLRRGHPRGQGPVRLPPVLLHRPVLHHDARRRPGRRHRARRARSPSSPCSTWS